MTAPLEGLRVWITRPSEGAVRSAEHWSTRGASVLVGAVLELEGVDPDPRLRAMLAAVPSARCVVALTSAHAAAHFARTFGPVAPDGGAWICAAVGGRTADVARAHGLSVGHVATRATAADLATEMVKVLRPRRVLFPGSDRRRGELPRHLRSAGVEVVDFTLYRNRPVPEWDDVVRGGLRRGDLDLVAVYSPSAVEAVVERWPADAVPIESMTFAALGPTTADAVRARGLELVAEPENPGEAALLTAVERWWSARGSRSG